MRTFCFLLPCLLIHIISYSLPHSFSSVKFVCKVCGIIQGFSMYYCKSDQAVYRNKPSLALLISTCKSCMLFCSKMTPHSKGQGSGHLDMHCPHTLAYLSITYINITNVFFMFTFFYNCAFSKAILELRCCLDRCIGFVCLRLSWLPVS